MSVPQAIAVVIETTVLIEITVVIESTVVIEMTVHMEVTVLIEIKKAETPLAKLPASAAVEMMTFALRKTSTDQDACICT